MNTIKTIAAIAIAAASISASARTVTVTLDGDWNLQSGSVASDAGIAVLAYQMGPQTMGLAVFQPFMATGYNEAPLIGDIGGRYSRHIWEVYGANSFTFSGLDIDRIGLPDEVLDYTGASLRGAYVEVTWADGFYKRIPLNATPWAQTQILTWTDVAPVPEPAALLMMLAGLGVLGFAAGKLGGKA